MPRLFIVAASLLLSVPAAAQQASPPAGTGLQAPLEIPPGAGDPRESPSLRGLFGGAPAAADDRPDGFVGSTLATVERVLGKLGVSEDDLASALSQVRIEDAGDNWREESSGELRLSFDVNERLSIGPSFGLRHEEENLGGVEAPWSQQVKFGARLNF